MWKSDADKSCRNLKDSRVMSWGKARDEDMLDCTAAGEGFGVGWSNANNANLTAGVGSGKDIFIWGLGHPKPTAHSKTSSLQRRIENPLLL